jgi:hypothetical protein
VAAQFYAFIHTLRRYTVGIFPEHTNWSEMWDSAWQPPLGWQFLSIAYLITLTVGAVLTYRALFPTLPSRKAMPGVVRYEGVSITPAKVDTGRLVGVTVPDEGERRDAL